jgi:hypothetical protein
VPYLVHLTDVAGSVPCRVIAKLQPQAWRVVVGVGIGQLDGGMEIDLDEEELPTEVRRPNAEFYITWQQR